jgi:hypothetical protein
MKLIDILKEENRIKTGPEGLITSHLEVLKKVMNTTKQIIINGDDVDPIKIIDAVLKTIEEIENLRK